MIFIFTKRPQPQRWHWQTNTPPPPQPASQPSERGDENHMDAWSRVMRVIRYLFSPPSPPPPPPRQTSTHTRGPACPSSASSRDSAVVTFVSRSHHVTSLVTRFSVLRSWRVVVKRVRISCATKVIRRVPPYCFYSLLLPTGCSKSVHII